MITARYVNQTESQLTISRGLKRAQFQLVVFLKLDSVGLSIMTLSSLRALAFVTASLMAGSATLLSPYADAANAYRWVDANGVVNFSERKPQGVPDHLVTVIETRSSGSLSSRAPSRADGTAADSGVAGTTGTDSSVLNERQRAMLGDLEAAEAERQDQVQRIRSDNCARARSLLASLSGTGRVRVVDENGETTILTEEDRSQRIAAAQQGIVNNCDA